MSEIIRKIPSTKVNKIRDQSIKTVENAICFETTSIIEFKDKNVTWSFFSFNCSILHSFAFIIFCCCSSKKSICFFKRCHLMRASRDSIFNLWRRSSKLFYFFIFKKVRLQNIAALIYLTHLFESLFMQYHFLILIQSLHDLIALISILIKEKRKKRRSIKNLKIFCQDIWDWFRNETLKRGNNIMNQIKRYALNKYFVI